MMKKILTLALISGLFFACNMKTNQSTDQVEETVQITELTIEKLIADPEAYAGQDIKFNGTVSHVCKHGGKRMFLYGDSAVNVVLIVTGEDMSPFSPEIEGSTLELTGNLIVNKIDEEYLAEMEAEIAEGNEVEARQIHDHSDEELTGEEEHQHAEGEEHEEEGEHDPDAAKKRYIENMRKEIAESENGYVLEYFIECIEFKAIETEE